MKFKFANLVFFLVISIYVFAADPVILLRDGTSVSGRIVDFNQGIYTIESKSLGKLVIKQSEVTGINYDGAVATSAKSIKSESSQTELFALQQSLVQDKGIMSLVESLQNDPDVMAILADPEIMNAVSSGDVASLMSNEKIIRLMNNSKVKSITNQVAN